MLITFGQQGGKLGSGSGPAEDMPAALDFTRDSTRLPFFLAASLALHLCVLTVFVLTERAPQLKPDAQQEIPVELVTDPAKGASGTGKDAGKPSNGPVGVKPSGTGKPAVPKPPDAVKPAAPPQPAAAKPQPPKPPVAAPKPPAAVAHPAPKPPEAKPPEPKPPEAKPPEPKPPEPKPPEVKPAAPKPVAETPKPPPPPPVAAAPKPPPPPVEAAKPQPVAPKPLPQPMLQPAPPAAPTGPAGTPQGDPQGLMQDDSKPVVAPKASDDGDEGITYQSLVLGTLELKKDFPADAMRRGVFGTAEIYFELNDDGSVKSEKLLKSSGDASLDIESLALVQRCAPFPKPPVGAEKVYAVDIVFPAPK